MRALTVRQPWAEAIADGLKLIENRSFGFPKRYRGTLAIHAGKGWSRRAPADARLRDAWTDERNYALRHVPAYHGRPPHPFLAGVVLAVADVADIHTAARCCAPWGEETYVPSNDEQRPPGRVTHIVLEQVIRVRPIAAKGALGLWRPDEDLELEIAHALAELVTWDLEGARRVADSAGIEELLSVVREPA